MGSFSKMIEVMKMENDNVFCDPEKNLLYWENNRHLAVTLIEFYTDVATIDVGLLNKWEYPEEAQGDTITNDEIEKFKEDVTAHMNARGFRVNIEESRLESTKRKRFSFVS